MHKLLAFKMSKSCSVGVEIELQIINSYTFELLEKSIDILKSMECQDHPGIIKPEVVQNMIELNSSVHDTVASLNLELQEIKSYFVGQAKILGVRFSGGGRHPLHCWKNSKISPQVRYRKISRRYDYVAKQYTIFGQHIHIGCASADDAIYLTHAFNHYLPHFIVLSASSPFYEGVDTNYHSTRLNNVITLPTSGHIPFIQTWKEFSAYFHKMYHHGIVESMKDFYWDVRPKPEFGTVELRVCDTPLTIETAVMLAAYAQTLAHYILQEKKYKLTVDSHILYNYNRFQASRFGFSGEYIDPNTGQHRKIGEDILMTIDKMEAHAHLLGNLDYLNVVVDKTKQQYNDTYWIRQAYKKLNSFPDLVREQSKLWMGN